MTSRLGLAGTAHVPERRDANQIGDIGVGWRKPSVDAVTGLSLLLILLFAVPAPLVVGPLGAAGTPAKITGALALLVWSFIRIYRARLDFVDSPVRKVLFLWCAANMASYVMATTRPIDGAELRSADRALISLLSWMGVVIIGGEIHRWDRLEVLIRRLVMAGGGLAMLGLLQFFTHRTLVDLVQIPGLKVNSDFAGFLDRSGFSRPPGTATHPIEFGVVLTTILPLAIHLLVADEHRHWLRRAVPVAAIGMAVPVSVSRSAVIGALVGVAIMLPTWPVARRRRAYLAMGVGMIGVYLTIPGLLGAIRGMFAGIGSDNSIASRTGSYDLALSLVGRSPVLGRGLGTFIPDYRILDNQYLGTLIETGIVGLLVLLGLFAMAVRSCVSARADTDDPGRRGLAVALIGSICAGASSFATFDAFSFPMLATVVFVLMGCIDALWRLRLQGVTGAAAGVV